MQRPVTTFFLTIVLAAYLALLPMIIAFMLMLDSRVPNVTTRFLWTSTIMFAGSCAVGRVLAGRLVRWAWKE